MTGEERLDYSTAPAGVRIQLEHAIAGIADVLGRSLVGHYLHGSLALGSFNPARSDRDLLVVTRHMLDAAQKRRLMQLLLAISRNPSPIEISFLNQAQLSPWEHPARYDLHFSEDWRERVTAALRDPGWPANETSDHRDEDLAAHIAVTLARGVTLAGPPPADVFPVIPAEHVKASLEGDFRWARERAHVNPVYFVLNTCRLLAYLAEGRLLSKAEGAAWALRHMPAEFHALVTAARSEHMAEPGASALDVVAVQRLGAFAARRLEAVQ